MNDCAVLISSCDTYSDLWGPFFTLFFRYWPDCPFPIYLVSNSLRYSDSRVKTILVGSGGTWSDDIKKALLEISSPFIIYLQEDYLFRSRVNTGKIESLVDYVSQNPVASVRFIGKPDPAHKHLNPFDLGKVEKGEPYRLSLQGALWRKEIFARLLKSGETGWETEIAGSRRTDELGELFLSARKGKPLLDYYPNTAIKKGKWFPGALKLLKWEGIKIDPTTRGVLSAFKLLLGRLKNTLSKFMHRLFGHEG